MGGEKEEKKRWVMGKRRGRESGRGRREGKEDGEAEENEKWMIKEKER